MQVFDDERILRSGLSFRDLILIALIIFVLKLVFVALLYITIPTKLDDYGFTTRVVQFKWLAELVVMPVLGLLVSFIIKGSSRFFVQITAMFVLTNVFAGELARLAVRMLGEK